MPTILEELGKYSGLQGGGIASWWRQRCFYWLCWKTGGCGEHKEGELVGGGDEICGGVGGGVEGDTLVGTKLIY
jgi:hypothetical protein